MYATSNTPRTHADPYIFMISNQQHLARSSTFDGHAVLEGLINLSNMEPFY